MNLNEMRTKTQELIARCVALSELDEMTPEQKSEFDSKLAESKELDAKIAAREELDQMADAYKANQLNEPMLPTDSPKRQPANEFKSLAEQLTAVVHAEQSGGRIDPRLKATGLSEGTPSDGGFLVSPTFSNELLRNTYEVGEVSQRTRSRVTLGPGTNSLVLRAVDETSRATGSRRGGVQAYWLAEAAEITASQPKFRQMQWTPKKIAAMYYATEELLQDANAMQQVVSGFVAEELNWMIEDSFLNGSGVGQPLGIMNAGALVTVDAEDGQAAATIVYENVIKMWSRMRARNRANAVWLINQDIEPQLFQMYLAVGTAGVPVYIPANGAAGSPLATLMGRPVIPVEYCATLGTTGDILLVDMNEYLPVDKGGMKADASMHVRFIYDEMAFRFTYRIDGQPLWHSALTPANGSNTLSPYVALATRS